MVLKRLYFVHSNPHKEECTDIKFHVPSNANTRSKVRGMIRAIEDFCNIGPDICYAVNVLSRYCENPGRQHWQGVKRILRYLKGTKSMELVYKREAESKLIGFCDADWGGEIDERKSTTGYVFTYAGGAVTWSTKRQPTVALSTTEAEFMAMTAAVQEGTWLKQIMNELLPLFEKCITIHSDNKGALELAKNNQYSPRTKHIDIKHKFVNEINGPTA